MTDDEILLLADQYTENRYIRTVTKEMMIAFARAIAAKEREACIDIVRAEIRPGDETFTKIALHTVAVKIESRGK